MLLLAVIMLASNGGAIYQNSEVVGTITTTITNSTFSGNSASLGSALYNKAPLTSSYAISSNLL